MRRSEHCIVDVVGPMVVFALLAVVFAWGWERECVVDDIQFKNWQKSNGVNLTDIEQKDMSALPVEIPKQPVELIAQKSKSISKVQIAQKLKSISKVQIAQKLKPSKQYIVWATREGLVGKRTASGRIIKSSDVFVALPCRSVLGRKVCVTYGKTTVICKVLDVGPWSIGDDYWSKGRRPLSESSKRIPSRWGRARNKAGIDLSDGLWSKFGISRGCGMVKVRWSFVGD